MEFTIKIVVMFLIIMIVGLIIIGLIMGWKGSGEDSIASFFNWVSGGPKKP